jgi:tetratricopeptide (TPR) repeat protein
MGSGASAKKKEKQEAEIRHNHKVLETTQKAKAYARQGNYEKQKIYMRKALKLQEDYYGPENKVSFKITNSETVDKIVNQDENLWLEPIFASGTKFAMSGFKDYQFTLLEVPGLNPGKKIVRAVDPNDGNNYLMNNKGECLRLDKAQGQVTFQGGGDNPRVEAVFHGPMDEALEFAVTLEELANAHANLANDLLKTDPLNVPPRVANYMEQKDYLARNLAIVMDYYRGNPWHYQVGNAQVSLAKALANFNDISSTNSQKRLLEEALSIKEGFRETEQLIIENEGPYTRGRHVVPQTVAVERDGFEIEEVCYSLGHIYVTEGRYDDVKWMWERARAIRRKAYSEGHWLVQQINEDLRQLPLETRRQSFHSRQSFY